MTTHRSAVSTPSVADRAAWRDWVGVSERWLDRLLCIRPLRWPGDSATPVARTEATTPALERVLTALEGTTAPLDAVAAQLDAQHVALLTRDKGLLVLGVRGGHMPAAPFGAVHDQVRLMLAGPLAGLSVPVTFGLVLPDLSENIEAHGSADAPEAWSQAVVLWSEDVRGGLWRSLDRWSGTAMTADLFAAAARALGVTLDVRAAAKTRPAERGLRDGSPSLLGRCLAAFRTDSATTPATAAGPAADPLADLADRDGPWWSERKGAAAAMAWLETIAMPGTPAAWAVAEVFAYDLRMGGAQAAAVQRLWSRLHPAGAGPVPTTYAELLASFGPHDVNFVAFWGADLLHQAAPVEETLRRAFAALVEETADSEPGASERPLAGTPDPLALAEQAAASLEQDLLRPLRDLAALFPAAKVPTSLGRLRRAEGGLAWTPGVGPTGEVATLLRQAAREIVEARSHAAEAAILRLRDYGARMAVRSDVAAGRLELTVDDRAVAEFDRVEVALIVRDAPFQPPILAAALRRLPWLWDGISESERRTLGLVDFRQAESYVEPITEALLEFPDDELPGAAPD